MLSEAEQLETDVDAGGGERSAILLHPPLPVVGVSIVTLGECQQNDRTLADG